jgi:hypothetical protein
MGGQGATCQEAPGGRATRPSRENRMGSRDGPAHESASPRHLKHSSYTINSAGGLARGPAALSVIQCPGGDAEPFSLRDTRVPCGRQSSRRYPARPLPQPTNLFVGICELRIESRERGCGGIGTRSVQRGRTGGKWGRWETDAAPMSKNRHPNRNQYPTGSTSNARTDASAPREPRKTPPHLCRGVGEERPGRGHFRLEALDLPARLGHFRRALPQPTRATGREDVRGERRRRVK